MGTRQLDIVRVTDGRLWHALDDDEVAGGAHLLTRPDGRAFVAVDAWREDVFIRLLAAVVDDTPRDLRCNVDDSDHAQIALYERADFGLLRREDEFVVPTTATAGTLPHGYTLHTADTVDVAQLASLDEELRQDVPGCDGWVNDVETFRRNVINQPWFDASTYLIAIDDSTGRPAGMARAWRTGHSGRLGLLGVRQPHRRRRLALTLLETALRPLREKGVALVTAEADSTNSAAQALLARLGATRTGGSVELVRRRLD